MLRTFRIRGNVSFASQSVLLAFLRLFSAFHVLLRSFIIILSLLPVLSIALILTMPTELSVWVAGRLA